MDFCANKMPVEVINEGAFGGTYFRSIYSSVTRKWYRKSWKEFEQLKDIDQKYYFSSYHDASVIKHGVKCGTFLRFWKIKVGLMKLILMVGFSGILNTGWVEDRKMKKDKLIDAKKIVSRFKGKLVKIIKDVGSKYDDSSVSPRIRQILLHWGYELTEKDFFNNLTN